jgi:phage terminase large subunit-like protein
VGDGRGRKAKSLLDLVEDGTFSARHHEARLAGEQLPWKTLSRFQDEYRAAKLDIDRRRIAHEFQKAIPQLQARQARSRKSLDEILDSLGPPRSADRVVNFFPRFFRHFAGPRAGRPFRLEPFQEDYIREFWRRHPSGGRVYTFGLFGIPKGNGKTPLAAGLGVNALLDPPVGDVPEVWGIAGAKSQAGFAHKFIDKSSRETDLGRFIKKSGETISSPDRDGEYGLLSSEGFNAHGINPSAGIIDEWWQFKHPHQREGVNAITEALQKRPGESFAQAISQAYFDYDTMLAEFHQASMKHPKLRISRDGCLAILEDEKSGTLMHWYGLAEDDDRDIENPALVRACNPLSALTPESIIALLHRPGADEGAWRRLHMNQPTRGMRPWLPRGAWARLFDDARAPLGAEIFIAVDAAYSGDTTAVVYAWRGPTGRIHLKAKVWSTKQAKPAHVHVRDSILRNEELVEPYIHELARDYRIREIVFDDQYFVTEANHLAREGFTIAPMHPNSNDMKDAVRAFKKGVDEATWAHDGDEVLASHLGNCVGVTSMVGTKEFDKIDKPGRDFPIDAATAAVMVGWRALVDDGARPFVLVGGRKKRTAESSAASPPWRKD